MALWEIVLVMAVSTTPIFVYILQHFCHSFNNVTKKRVKLVLDFVLNLEDLVVKNETLKSEKWVWILNSQASSWSQRKFVRDYIRTWVRDIWVVTLCNQPLSKIWPCRLYRQNIFIKLPLKREVTTWPMQLPLCTLKNCWVVYASKGRRGGLEEGMVCNC